MCQVWAFGFGAGGVEVVLDMPEAQVFDHAEERAFAAAVWSGPFQRDHF